MRDDIAAEHPFAPWVRIIGRGKRARRDLTRDEARTAFRMLLDGQATAAQVGAFLLLLRVKEETPDELAGFVDACRDWIGARHALPAADLDWPSYAGKKKHHPWYLLVPLLLAENGHRVFMHGGAEHTPGRLYTDTALRRLGMAPATSLSEAQAQLRETCFTYVPLSVLCAPLDSLLELRFELGLRSPVNTLARCINPTAAAASMQSVFHPAYNSLQQGAAVLLQEPQLLLFKGEGGEIEIRPDADTRLYGLRDGQPLEISWPSVLPRQPAPEHEPDVGPLLRLWRNETRDIYGEQAVLQTLAVALFGMGAGGSMEEARSRALDYWRRRDPHRL